jgi:hypothetical protein
MEQSGCGDECKFYEALRCYEVVGLAGVQRIPTVSQALSPVILKAATVSHPALLSSSPYSPAHKKH